jgi:hypothetical protein
MSQPDNVGPAVHQIDNDPLEWRAIQLRDFNVAVDREDQLQVANELRDGHSPITRRIVARRRASCASAALFCIQIKRARNKTITKIK